MGGLKKLFARIGFLLFVITILAGAGLLCICYYRIAMMGYRYWGYSYSVRLQGLTSEHISWCSEHNIKYKSPITFISFIFRCEPDFSSEVPLFFNKEEDAMAFKLRWL